MTYVVQISSVAPNLDSSDYVYTTASAISYPWRGTNPIPSADVAHLCRTGEVAV
jgi:hypothetical protein